METRKQKNVSSSLRVYQTIVSSSGVERRMIPVPPGRDCLVSFERTNRSCLSSLPKDHPGGITSVGVSVGNLS